MMRMRTAIGVLLVGLLFPALAFAERECRPEEMFDQRLDDYMKAALPVDKLAEEAARDTPRAAALSQQNSAPSVSGTLATLVDSAGFSELISAAFDRNVGSNSSDALTANVNPFALAAIGSPSVYYDQKQYEKPEYTLLRRIGGTASFGGKGDSFDRDGDGKPDPALDSEKFNDIVAWEFRARVYGSRDRRDRGQDFLTPDNFGRFHRKAEEVFVQFMAEHGKLTTLLRLKEKEQIPDPLRENPSRCLTDAEWQQLLAEPWFSLQLERAVRAALAVSDRYLEAAEEIDNQMLWTVAAVGLQREKKFGPDKLGASLRGTWRAATFNFDWMSVEGLGMAKTSNEYKVGAKYATQILKGGYFTEGIDASASAAYEIFDNVPDAAHDSNVKLQGRFDIPIMTGVTIPLSVTWANHRDLFSDGDRVFGHLGINVDLSKLLQKNSSLAVAAAGS